MNTSKKESSAFWHIVITIAICSVFCLGFYYPNESTRLKSAGTSAEHLIYLVPDFSVAGCEDEKTREITATNAVMTMLAGKDKRTQTYYGTVWVTNTDTIIATFAGDAKGRKVDVRLPGDPDLNDLLSQIAMVGSLVDQEPDIRISPGGKTVTYKNKKEPEMLLPPVR